MGLYWFSSPQLPQLLLRVIDWSNRQRAVNVWEHYSHCSFIDPLLRSSERLQEWSQSQKPGLLLSCNSSEHESMIICFFHTLFCRKHQTLLCRFSVCGERLSNFKSQVINWCWNCVCWFILNQESNGVFLCVCVESSTWTWGTTRV